MNVFVINLTRFGDILQTQAAVNGLTAQGHRVGMLCLDNFAPAVALLENVEYAATLPGGRLLARLEADWRRGAADLQELFTQWRREFPADLVLNLTASLSARVLARAFAGASLPIRGFGLDELGFGVDGNVWTSFLQGSTLRRLCCPYNLTDVFREVCGVGGVPAVNRLRRPEESLIASMREKLASTAPEDCSGFVAFQLGASEERRQWPAEFFADLAGRLWDEQRLCPVLVGASSEKHLAQSYARAARSPFVDCIAQTTLPELGALLINTRLLVTNDTGTMHLAAGLEVPVLAIFLATAQPWDTGPYLAGSCCLEPRLPCHPCAFGKACPNDERCKTRISPDTVAELTLTRLNAGEWKPDELCKSEARIWQSRRDADGCMGLRCLSGDDGDDRTLWIALQRKGYRHILDELDGKKTSNALPPLPQDKLSAAFAAPILESLRQTLALLHLMSEQSALLERAPDQQTGKRILGSASRLGGLLEQRETLNALGYLWSVLMQERGGSLASLAQCIAALQRGIQYWRLVIEKSSHLA
ncbi:MAG: glycosyltransferase family 9 protein [Deltaproteobacteria bacterium]|jgi:ADP-heptose:LPS heptosyltransferase|nr:glycosyltransferase family 9 protein [Deltaproteobacteria bacterium]